MPEGKNCRRQRLGPDFCGGLSANGQSQKFKIKQGIRQLRPGRTGSVPDGGYDGL